MNKFLITIVLIFSVSIAGCGEDEKTDTSKSQERDKTSYNLIVQDLFTDETNKHSKNSKKKGLLTLWHGNGQKSFEVNIKNGKKEGPFSLWYKSGQKMIQGNYKDDKGEGLLTKWNEDGQKIFQVNLKNGKREGLLIKWRDNGQKEHEQNYKDGKLIAP